MWNPIKKTVVLDEYGEKKMKDSIQKFQKPEMSVVFFFFFFFVYQLVVQLYVIKYFTYVAQARSGFDLSLYEARGPKQFRAKVVAP